MHVLVSVKKYLWEGDIFSGMAGVSSAEIENGHLVAQRFAEIEKSASMTDSDGVGGRIVAAATDVESATIYA